MREKITLDPEAITKGSRVEVQISGDGGGPIEVTKDGVDWGDAEIEAFMASLGGVGSVPVDFDIPNRVITMKVKIQASGDVTFAQARSMLQAKVAQLQAEGGWIGREMPGVGTVYADVVNAKLNLPGDWMQAHRDKHMEVPLSLEAIPEFYEDWEEWIDLGSTTNGELTKPLTGIRGDFPKGNRCEIEVTNTSSKDFLGLEWAVRSRHYDAAPTAALFYEAEALKPLDLAAVVTLSGASGGASNNAVRHDNLGTAWTPVQALQLADGTHLTHTDTYRLEARVYTTSPVPPEVRLAYDVGDLVNPAENDPVQVPGSSNFYIVDLGEVRLDRTPVGDHRWLGVLQARGAAGGENITVDRYQLRPIGESSGVLSAPIRIAPGLADYLLRDEFNQSSGALVGKTMPVGGLWAAPSGGDADDFAINATKAAAERTAVSDAASLENGRFTMAGSTVFGDIAMRVDIETSLISTSLSQGVVLWYASHNSWSVVRLFLDSDGVTKVGITSRAGGTTGFHKFRPVAYAANSRVSLYVVARSSDSRISAWVLPVGGVPTGVPDIVWGPPAAPVSGKVGLFDHYTGATAATRTYDGFVAWTPTRDAVAYAGQSAELRTDGMFREDSAGTGYGPVARVIGDLPRLPNGTAEIMLAASRGDFGSVADSGLDPLDAQVRYRPTWLTVPSS